MNKSSTSRNAVATLTLVFGILFVLGFACNSGSKPLPPEYVGAWTGDDGSTITLRGDATGDYISGGTKVTGGAVEIDDAKKELTIKLVGMGPTFKIDKAPTGSTMTLSGVVYRKSGGADTTSSDTKSSNTVTAKKGEVPSDDDLQSLARQTMLDFNKAIQDDDFTEFHKTLAKPFQRQASAEKLAGVFSSFVTAGVNFSEVSDLDANFSSTPTIEKSAGYDMLNLKGQYATTPRKTNFDLKYIFEDGAWKLGAINVNTKDNQ